MNDLGDTFFLIFDNFDVYSNFALDRESQIVGTALVFVDCEHLQVIFVVKHGANF